MIRLDSRISIPGSFFFLSKCFLFFQSPPPPPKKKSLQIMPVLCVPLPTLINKYPSRPFHANLKDLNNQCNHYFLELTCFRPLETLNFFTVGLNGSMEVYKLSPVSKVMECLCHGHTTHSRPWLSWKEEKHAHTHFSYLIGSNLTC